MVPDDSDQDADSSFPFSNGNLNRLQLLYRSVNFDDSKIYTINSMGLRAGIDDAVAYNETTFDPVQVTMSTSNLTDGVRLSTLFADNIGSDVVTVFTNKTFTIPANAEPSTTEFEIVLAFDAPFVYDPSEGGLLIDIQMNPNDLGDFRFDAYEDLELGERIFDFFEPDEDGIQEDELIVLEFMVDTEDKPDDDSCPRATDEECPRGGDSRSLMHKTGRRFLIFGSEDSCTKRCVRPRFVNFRLRRGWECGACPDEE